MIDITNINSQRFALNSIQHFKNYTPIVLGDYMRIVNTYDSVLEIVPPTHFSQIKLDGANLNTIADLQAAILPVLFTRDTLGNSGSSGDLFGNWRFIEGSYVQKITGVNENALEPNDVVFNKIVEGKRLWGYTYKGGDKTLIASYEVLITMAT